MRIANISSSPGVVVGGGDQGGGTQITQICTQMDADGFVHRIGGSARAEIGKVVLWAPCPGGGAVSVATTQRTELFGRSPSPYHGEGDRG